MNARLVLDTNVVSYLFRGGPTGAGYCDLIGAKPAGLTLLSIAELRSGVVRGNWGPERLAGLDRFLGRFAALPSTIEIANLCGALIGQRSLVGRAMAWPDAWAAATAIWLDLPLVTHDRDLEGIPGLRVLTLHRNWRVQDEPVFGTASPTPLTPEEVARAEATFAIEFLALLARLRRSHSQSQQSVHRSALTY